MINVKNEYNETIFKIEQLQNYISYSEEYEQHSMDVKIQYNILLEHLNHYCNVLFDLMENGD